MSLIIFFPKEAYKRCKEKVAGDVQRKNTSF